MNILATLSRGLLIASVACALSLAPSTGFAQDERSDEDAAKQHFEAGAEHFYEKNYSRAIIEFQRAYRYQPDPMILFNISAAHLRLENFEDALRFAQRAAEDGGLPDKITPRNAAKIDAIEARLRAESVAGRIAPEPRADSVAAPDGDGQSAEGSGQEARLGALGWSGVGLAGLGAGMLGYATYVELSLSDDIDAYDQAADGDPARYRELREDIDSRQQIGRVALYSGAGLAGLGLSLWLVDRLGADDTESATVSVSPGVGAARIDVTIPFR